MSGQYKCNTHPDAPHGFDRNASHGADRYVCECESWVNPMSQDRIAFEKVRLNVLGVIDKRTLSDGSYLDSETQKDWMLWQAATAEANKRIVELESRHERDSAEYASMREAYAEVKASNNALREAISEAISTYNLPVTARLAEAISATPAESLQAFENEVIEMCAKVCDEISNEHNDPFQSVRCANGIRYLKGKL